MMDKHSTDSVKSILIRLEDARREVQSLANRAEYPVTSMFERALDSIENAEKFLKNTIER